MMDNLPETTPVLNEPAPKRLRRWLWALPVLLILGLLGGAFAVRQTETRHWEAGQTAVAAGDWETAVTEFSAVINQWPPFLRQHIVEATALRGVAYFQQQEQRPALADFDAALLLDSNQIDIFAYRALVHYDDEEWELALADTESALAQPEFVPDHLLAQLHAKLALLPDDLVADDEQETAVAAALELVNYLPEETVAELYTVQAEYSFAASEPEQTLSAINRALALETELADAQQGRLLPQKAHLLAAAGRWPDALATIDEALQLEDAIDEPTQAALYDLRGQIYFAQGDWEQAITEAEAALELDDSLAWPKAALAWQAYRQADYDTAQAQAEAAIAIDDAVGLAYTVQGALLTWQGDVHGALEMLEMALMHNPEDVEALALRAYNLVELNDTEEIIAAAETAVAAQPNAPATKWVQAMAAAEDRDWSLAFALMNQAIALDDGRPEFYLFRSHFYPYQGDWEKIVADLETSLELNPEFGPAIMGLAYAHGDRYDFTDLETIQQELLEKWPDWFAVHILSGFYYEEAVGDDEQALAAYSKAIELLPERSNVYLPRGYFYLSIHELEQAEADFEAALELDEENGAALAGLAAIAAANNDSDLQFDYLSQAMEATKDGRSARLDLAYYYILVANENEKTWEIAHQLIAEDETDALAHLLIAIVHVFEGNNEQALTEIDRVLELNPYLGFAYFIQADALLNLERYAEAARAAEKVWELDQDAYEVHQTLFFIALEEGDMAEAERQYHLWLGNKPEYANDYALQANMELYLGRFEEAIASFTTAIAEDEDNEGLLFGRAIAGLNFGDDDSYKADFEQIVESSTVIEFISDAEYWLAVDNGLLVAADGLATFTDEVAGFQISYPASWERPLLGPDDEFLFVAVAETLDGVQSINLFKVDGVAGLTVNDVAIIVAENVNQSNGIVMLDSHIGEVAGNPAFIFNYELTVQEGLGVELVYLGRQHIVLVGNVAWFITIESNEDFFEESLPIYEEIIGSIQFLE
ncbi:tetratricopeptide repeat protein [Candidatus Leptofilum sp.]|uniref:tetratricopeptide repeat protein n=1 Tax=Candidatus Leptofilum sp. TaxID=3241576 RepID=UPI003B5B7B1D